MYSTSLNRTPERDTFAPYRHLIHLADKPIRVIYQSIWSEW